MDFKFMESVVFTSSSISVHKHFLISTQKLVASPAFHQDSSVTYLRPSKNNAVIADLR